METLRSLVTEEPVSSFERARKENASLAPAPPADIYLSARSNIRKIRWAVQNGGMTWCGGNASQRTIRQSKPLPLFRTTRRKSKHFLLPTPPVSSFTTLRRHHADRKRGRPPAMVAQ